MRAFLFAAFLLIGLSACAGTDPHTSFAIENGALKPDELALDAYPKVNFSARVFDVVNQDMAAEHMTELAGKVDPMPVDILSSYAAKKFKAVGGLYTTRFVIRQAKFIVRTARDSKDDANWMNGVAGVGQTYGNAEMSLTLDVMLTASRRDSLSANVMASTTQTQKISFNTSHAERRKAYLDMMKRALDALDAEINKNLPSYMNEAMLHG